MSQPTIEPLEGRQLLAAAVTLSADDVRKILGQAASQSMSSDLSEEVIAVADRNATIVGIFARKGVDLSTKRGQQIEILAVARARTAALFSSDQNAFTSRTARFIIQDHFPAPINGTEGGPLYGVQFSNLVGSDVVPNAPAISGDPGGVPLYINGVSVGGVGAAGDGHDEAARADLADITPQYKPTEGVFNGHEESDMDESIALAGSVGYMPSSKILATQTTINGLRLPYIASDVADSMKTVTLTSLITHGAGKLVGFQPHGFPAPQAFPYVTDAAHAEAAFNPQSLQYTPATFSGISGIIKNRITSTSTTSDAAHALTRKDVAQVFTDAIATAKITRAGIRQPIGVDALVHVVVVDTTGAILGVFAEDGATNFSYDVAVQKARTANYFSDNTHAFSTRAIGFLSQLDSPPGIDGDQIGPFYHVQNDLSPGLALIPTNNGAANPLKNGITIFPGGVPLYKNGVMVGAVGVSGDGVDQDDRIAYAGATDYQPATATRDDKLSTTEVRNYLAGKAVQLFQLFGKTTVTSSKYPALAPDLTVEDVVDRLQDVDYRLPYVKFPRNPNV